MKVLAILTLKPETPLETIRPRLVNEIKESWTLYASGALREVYATDLPHQGRIRVEADNTAAAHRHLAPLPLVAAGLFQIDCMELRPFVNWSALFRH
jgi:hypothetical protein